MTWFNDDGLMVKFGVEEAVLRNVGAYCIYGPVHELEILVDHAELSAVADGIVILNDNFAIPRGSLIESVEIRVPTEDFDSAADGALLSVGTVDQDRTSNGTTDSLVDAATETELNAGGENVAGWIGSAVGTELTSAKLLTWEVDGEAFTAGTSVVRVRWSVDPKNAEDTLIWDKSTYTSPY